MNSHNNPHFVFLGGAIQNGSNGFTAVGLHASGSPPTINNGSNNQPLPIQSIKPIQAVQPQIHNTGKWGMPKPPSGGSAGPD